MTAVATPPELLSPGYASERGGQKWAEPRPQKAHVDHACFRPRFGHECLQCIREVCRINGTWRRPAISESIDHCEPVG